MRNEAGTQQEQQHHASQALARESAVLAKHDLQRAIRQDAAHGRELMVFAGREVERRGDNLSGDARETLGPRAGAAVDEWREAARDAVDRTETAAAAFFRLVDAALESSARQDPRLKEISAAATRAVESFAAEIERQSAELMQSVGEALDSQREQDTVDAVQRSSEDTARERESFEHERLRLEAELYAVEALQAQQEEARQAQMDDTRRRDEEIREREARER